MSDGSPQDTVYDAVVNDEEQFSVWPADRELPAGWRPAGHRGTKDACLAWIDTHWTDMRPKSLREALGEADTSGGQHA
ncbi:MbtH family protein [Streptomyces sp. NPDC054796]